MESLTFRALKSLHLHLLENAQMDAEQANVEREVQKLEQAKASLERERDLLRVEHERLKEDEAVLEQVERELKDQKATLDLERRRLSDQSAGAGVAVPYLERACSQVPEQSPSPQPVVLIGGLPLLAAGQSATQSCWDFSQLGKAQTVPCLPVPGLPVPGLPAPGLPAPGLPAPELPVRSPKGSAGLWDVSPERGQATATSTALETAASVICSLGGEDANSEAESEDEAGEGGFDRARRPGPSPESPASGSLALSEMEDADGNEGLGSSSVHALAVMTAGLNLAPASARLLSTSVLVPIPSTASTVPACLPCADVAAVGLRSRVEAEEAADAHSCAVEMPAPVTAEVSSSSAVVSSTACCASSQDRGPASDEARHTPETSRAPAMEGPGVAQGSTWRGQLSACLSGTLSEGSASVMVEECSVQQRGAAADEGGGLPRHCAACGLKRRALSCTRICGGRGFLQPKNDGVRKDLAEQLSRVLEQEGAVVALIRRAISQHKAVLARCDRASQLYDSLLTQRDAVTAQYNRVLMLKRQIIDEMKAFKAERDSLFVL